MPHIGMFAARRRDRGMEEGSEPARFGRANSNRWSSGAAMLIAAALAPFASGAQDSIDAAGLERPSRGSLLAEIPESAPSHRRLTDLRLDPDWVPTGPHQLQSGGASMQVGLAMADLGEQPAMHLSNRSLFAPSSHRGTDPALPADNQLRLTTTSQQNNSAQDGNEGDPGSLDADTELSLAVTAPAAGADDLAKQLANPVASLISVPIQFNLDNGIGPKGTERLTVNIQPVIPFSLSEDWNLITRTIVPIVYQGSVAEGDDSDFGIGDIVQSFFFSPKEPVGGWILAAGPVALWPTGTDPQLRSEQFGIGPTFLALRQNKGWTYGGLVNHIWGVTESDDHPDINATFVQPFLAYSWPSATTLTLNAEATYDWTGEQWTVPLNVILSQVVKFGAQPMQLFIGGRYYAETPVDGQEWGIRFGLTFLFPN